MALNRLPITAGFLFLWLLLLSVTFVIHWFKVEQVLGERGKAEVGQGKLLRDILLKEPRKKTPAEG